MRFDGRIEPVASALVEVELAIHEWYPTWPVAGRLVEVCTQGGVDLDATLLTPIALAADLGLPLVTTSTEIAEIARPYVPAVLVI